jgi:hypothetical protein
LRKEKSEKKVRKSAKECETVKVFPRKMLMQPLARDPATWNRRSKENNAGAAVAACGAVGSSTSPVSQRCQLVCVCTRQPLVSTAKEILPAQRSLCKQGSVGSETIAT